VHGLGTRDRLQAVPVALESISVDVDLWHGRLDVLASCAPAEFLASKIPDCMVTIWPDEGHIAIARHWHEILDALASSVLTGDTVVAWTTRVACSS
jgi:hypothetical protein